jgi:hypothetical protein
MPIEDTGWLRLAGSSIAVLGAGTGAAMSVLLADPVTGAMAGQALAEVGNDIARRMLSPRQEARVGTVIELAASAVIAKETLGGQLRDDGFFDGDRSDAQEIIEGVLLAVKDDHQEQKLPYVANMLAEIAFSPLIDVNTANRMVEEADRMTWLDMRITAIVARGKEFPLPDVDLPNYGSTLADWTVFQAAATLRDDESRRLLLYEEKDNGMDLRMCALKLSPRGHLMATTMELTKISKAELRPVYEALLRVPPEPSPAGDVDQPV